MDFEKNQLISITDIAIDKFKQMLFDASEQDSFLKISLELEGTNMYYNMDIVQNPLENDKIYNYNGLKIIVNEEDELLLNGLNIDYIMDESGENFTLDNPNIISDLNDEKDGCCGRGCCY